MTKRRSPRASLVIDGARRLAEWTLMALIGVGPLVVHRGLMDAFALPKLTYAIPVALGSVALLSLQLARHPWSVSAVAREPVVRAVLPLVAIVAVGLVTSSHVAQVGPATAVFWIGAICLVAWTLGFEAETLERLLGLVVWPAAILAGIGILQFHDWYQPFDFLVGGKTARLRVTSLAGAVSDLAAYLVLPCLVLQARLYRDRGWRQGLAAVGLGVCAYALVITQTLTAIVALGLGSLVVWGAVLPRRWIGRGFLGVATLLVVALAVVAPLRERVSDKLARGVTGDLNFVLSGRLDAWRVAGRLMADHPISGVGLGAYRAEFADTKLTLLEEGVEFYPGHSFPTFTYAHNELLQLGAETGWPGLLAALWGLYALILALRRLDLDPGPRGLLLGSLAGLLVLSLGHFPFHLALTSMPALLLLAWSFRAAREAA